MFRNALSSSPGLMRDYIQRIAHFHEYYCASTRIVDYVKDQLLFLLSALDDNDEVDRYVPDSIKPDEEIDEYMDRIFTEEYEAWKEESGSDKNAFCFFDYNLANISTDLSICYPEFFVPYYFLANYNILSKIADTFDIPLPQIPKKSDYRGRTFHYVNICKRL